MENYLSKPYHPHILCTTSPLTGHNGFRRNLSRNPFPLRQRPISGCNCNVRYRMYKYRQVTIFGTPCSCLCSKLNIKANSIIFDSQWSCEFLNTFGAFIIFVNDKIQNIRLNLLQKCVVHSRFLSCFTNSLLILFGTMRSIERQVYSLFLYKNIVFLAQAKYSYFSADFRLKIFLYYS